MVGSHSATKLCRWTKSMLQGRGGCYKHTFYGINSHQCMEHTPNVSCANKCVFCWRNHINPVALDWKFAQDDPKQLLEESLLKHYRTIEQQCLSPNAIESRKAEARQVRHCALSLVGEPVAYPRVAEFLALLHSRRISSFLVTNGQFPDALHRLPRVTQLYLSCDAPDRDTMRLVGRPLFKDFWERFLLSMDILRDKSERTVCRLTCIRDVNMVPEHWAELLERARPDFIELKGVTMAPLFSKTGLTMLNIPTHREVKDFAEQLVDFLPDYSLASEHEHSNGVLLATRRLYMEDSAGDQSWQTWIDFERFADIWDSDAKISAEDYATTTPAWALYDSLEQGFSPNETRKIRKRARPLYSSEKRWDKIPKWIRPFRRPPTESFTSEKVQSNDQ